MSARGPDHRLLRRFGIAVLAVIVALSIGTTLFITFIGPALQSVGCCQ